MNKFCFARPTNGEFDFKINTSLQITFSSVLPYERISGEFIKDAINSWIPFKSYGIRTHGYSN